MLLEQNNKLYVNVRRADIPMQTVDYTIIDMSLLEEAPGVSPWVDVQLSVEAEMIQAQRLYLTKTDDGWRIREVAVLTDIGFANDCSDAYLAYLFEKNQFFFNEILQLKLDCDTNDVIVVENPCYGFSMEYVRVTDPRFPNRESIERYASDLYFNAPFANEWSWMDMRYNGYINDENGNLYMATGMQSAMTFDTNIESIEVTECDNLNAWTKVDVVYSNGKSIEHNFPFYESWDGTLQLGEYFFSRYTSPYMLEGLAVSEAEISEYKAAIKENQEKEKRFFELFIKYGLSYDMNDVKHPLENQPDMAFYRVTEEGFETYADIIAFHESIYTKKTSSAIQDNSNFFPYWGDYIDVDGKLYVCPGGYGNPEHLTFNDIEISSPFTITQYGQNFFRFFQKVIFENDEVNTVCTFVKEDGIWKQDYFVDYF